MPDPTDERCSALQDAKAGMSWWVISGNNASCKLGLA